MEACGRRPLISWSLTTTLTGMMSSCGHGFSNRTISVMSRLWVQYCLNYCWLALSSSLHDWAFLETVWSHSFVLIVGDIAKTEGRREFFLRLTGHQRYLERCCVHEVTFASRIICDKKIRQNDWNSAPLNTTPAYFHDFFFGFCKLKQIIEKLDDLLW